MDIRIRAMKTQDWEAVSKIYFEGIQTGKATFQTQIPTWEEWDEGHVKSCRLIAADGEGNVMGWAALTPVSSRCVYRGVGEVSVYVGDKFRKKGVAKLLLQALIQNSEEEGYWTLQAGIFTTNEASLNLHKAVGFKVVGIRERIGKTVEGVWQDTALLERRSNVVGVE
jgi:phosphinothricin acetyltransferase